MVTRLIELWENGQALVARSYTCGFCGDKVASERGWQTTQYQPNAARRGELRICPFCGNPTLFRNDENRQLPGPRLGAAIQHLPVDVGKLYDEARDACAAGAYTATVLALRKLLMHVAVEKGAAQGLSFIAYVEYLDQERYLGRDGKGWVDLIRTRSNEANHEIVLMSTDDAERLLLGRDVAEARLRVPRQAACPRLSEPVNESRGAG